MSFYLDASALIPLFKIEESSAVISDWVANLTAPILVSSLVIGEACSGFSRQVRQGVWDAKLANAAANEVAVWIEARATLVTVLNEDVIAAADLVKYPIPRLLMPDAIHLAICQRLELTLVTLDKDLLTIATREGVTAICPA